jgi:formiminoglutamase
MNLDRNLYKCGLKNQWHGRIDDPADEDSFRWHQCINFIDLNDIHEPTIDKNKTNFAFIGFKCNEGVIRNLGRPGAAKGPEYLRR